MPEDNVIKLPSREVAEAKDLMRRAFENGFATAQVKILMELNEHACLLDSLIRRIEAMEPPKV